LRLLCQCRERMNSFIALFGKNSTLLNDSLFFSDRASARRDRAIKHCMNEHQQHCHYVYQCKGCEEVFRDLRTCKGHTMTCVRLKRAASDETLNGGKVLF
jgi:hypothetical protein